MSSFNRRIACLALLALGACGFQPAYGPGQSGAALQGQVVARDPANRTDFLYLEALEARLGLPNAPRYALNYTLSISTASVGITAADVTTRYTLLGTAQLTLTDTATDAVVFGGAVEGFTGYSATGTQLASGAASADATERLVSILADRTVTRLLALDL